MCALLEKSTKCSRQDEDGMTGLGQPVLRGFRRQVQGSNGLNPAQPCRPLGSTQMFPPRHNRVKHHCQSGLIKAWGIAHIPRVDPREGRIRLSCEKGQPNNGTTDDNERTIDHQRLTAGNESTKKPPGWEYQRQDEKMWTRDKRIIKKEIGGVRCRAISPHQTQTCREGRDVECRVILPHQRKAYDWKSVEAMPCQWTSVNDVKR